MPVFSHLMLGDIYPVLDTLLGASNDRAFVHFGGESFISLKIVIIDNIDINKKIAWFHLYSSVFNA